MISVLNKQVSYFPGVTATAQGVEVNLLDLLQSNKHKETILHLRHNNEGIQKELKEKLPCYTVSGTFSQRRDDCLLQLSGLAAVDLDSAQNYDVIHLLNELKKIDCIAYAGLSCRGKRLFCIVPFKYPDKYVKQYERLLTSFADMGLPMGDDCHKRVSQPRFVSWNGDSTQFFNHDAKQYQLLPDEKKHYFVKRSYQYTGAGAVPGNAFQWCVEQVNKSYLFSVGARHDYIVHLARYCNLKGLPEDETLNGCLKFVQMDFPEAEIKNIILYIYKTQDDSHAKLPFNNKAAAFDYRTSRLQQRPELPPCHDRQANDIERSQQTEIEAAQKFPSKADEKNYPDKIGGWDQDIIELEHYFKTAILPAAHINLKPHETITDISKFIDGHLATVKANKGKRTYLPYLERLQDLKRYLTVNTN